MEINCGRQPANQRLPAGRPVWPLPPVCLQANWRSPGLAHAPTIPALTLLGCAQPDESDKPKGPTLSCEALLVWLRLLGSNEANACIRAVIDCGRQPANQRLLPEALPSGAGVWLLRPCRLQATRRSSGSAHAPTNPALTLLGCAQPEESDKQKGPTLSCEAFLFVWLRLLGSNQRPAD